MKYVLTKYETVRRTEKIHYVIEIPKQIKNKEKYAGKQVEEGNYLTYELSDIVDSELLGDKTVALKIKKG